jgi:hypothetical protein
MFAKSAFRMLVACLLYLSAECLRAADPPEQPPYVILLRSRDSAVTPERSKHAETGGGFIQVTKIAPDVVLIVMRGAAAAGDDHPGRAALQFVLNQDLEIQATRGGLRNPRLVATAWLIGSLHSSLRNGGTAEQSPACAVLRSAGEPIINMCFKPHHVGGGENLLVNERAGPVELVVAPGPFCLSQTFAINVQQERTCLSGSAAAHFDPDPKLDAHWNEVLKPFRAVPHRDFGFRFILRVVEDPPPEDVETLPPPNLLPPPKEIKKSVSVSQVQQQPQ